MIIVAQRVGTIMSADRIIVLDAGRVVGIGTHERAARDNETYREIVYSQLSERRGGGMSGVPSDPTRPRRTRQRADAPTSGTDAGAAGSAGAAVAREHAGLRCRASGRGPARRPAAARA